MFLFCLVFAMFCSRLFICASWSPAGKLQGSKFLFGPTRPVGQVV